MKKPLLIYVLVLLSYLFLIGYYSSFSNLYNRISASIKISDDKYDFLESSNSLINNLKDAESSQRGFLITNENQYLIPFESAKYRLSLEKDRFFGIAKKYGLYQTNKNELITLNFLIDGKINEMEQTVALFKTGNKSALNALVKSDIGLDYMSKIGIIFKKLNSDQKYKEIQAKQSINSNRVKFKLYTLLICIFCFVVLTVIAFYTWYFFIKNKEVVLV